MNTRILLSASMLFVFLMGCSNSDSPTEQAEISRLVVNNSSNDIGDRVQPVFEPVVLDPIPGKSGGAKSLEAPLTLIAEMSPPENQQGIPVRASFVQVNGDRAYVGYNKEGDVFAGAVEIIDISDPSQPTVISQALFEDVDVASLQLIDSGDKLFVGGGKSPDETGFERSAIVEVIDLSGGLLTSNSTIHEINGWVTNGLAWSSSQLWCSGGNSASVAGGGGVGAFMLGESNEFNTVVWDTFSQAQYLVGDGDNIVSLQAGTPGILRIYGSQVGFIGSFDIDAIEALDDKHTMILDGDNAWVALGENGLKVYSLSAGSGAPVYYLSRPLTPQGGIDPEYLTHSVALDDDYVYVANGAGGLYVAELPDTPGQELDVLGTWDFGSSANYVATSGDLVFVASGTGGLKILRKDAQGFEGSITLNDGDNGDYLHQAAFTGFPSGELTVEFWMKSNTNLHKSVPLSYSSPSYADDYVFSFDRNREFEYEIANENHYSRLNARDLGLEDHQWHHVAMSWENITGNLAIYVDGASAYTATGVFMGITTTDGGHLMVGQEQDSFGGGLQGAQCFAGGIADLRIWGTVRTPTQISGNYQNRLVGNETDLVSYWPLNEGTGTTCEDLAGDNDLEFVATPEWGPGFDIGN